jgi:acyl carrier protein
MDVGYRMNVHTDMQREVAALIIDTLMLDDVTVDQIDPHAPLFGDGLGLDSIDALEIAFAISKQYGFKLRSDDERNGEIFSSLSALARHIAESRTA